MPNLRVALGFGALLLSLGLFIPWTLPTHLVGYVAATLVASTIAGTARRASLMLAAETGKAEDPRLVIYVRLLLALGFLVGLAHASAIAWELSKR